MKRVLIQPEFEAWREAARDALREGYAPEEIDLQDATVASSPALSFELEAEATGKAIAQAYVPKGFLEEAAVVATHRNAKRWNLLYRVLYRLQGNRNLMKIETDADVAEMNRLASQVRRDLHKMHAFVRFRKVMQQGGDEHFVAWHQPDHRILPLAAPFFAERFAIMRWSILTPDASVSWDPVAKELMWSAGVPRESAPDEDELEMLWRSYYSSIYNPARLNTRAMRSEMPVRYWKNLPEITLLPTLITQSKTRVEAMVTKQQEKTSAAPFVPEEHTTDAIRAALPGCKGCELYCHATQVVGGVGPVHAKIMVVGEQPGDHEDKQGLPFVGPAGKLLDKILVELGIDRSKMYVTNAVKHFKFVQVGSLRSHRNPDSGEITACKPWLLAEIDAVKPELILCLGASAAKSLLGGTFALMKQRGEVLSTPYAERVMATLHPSAILRARDEQTREQMMEMFRSDLAKAALLVKA